MKVIQGLTGWLVTSDRFPVAAQGQTEVEAHAKLEEIEKLIEKLIVRRQQHEEKP